jgi:hypothetical protein
MAGLDEVPCRYSDIWHDDPQFVKELATHNLQRVKSRDEVLREAILGVDPKKAHKALSAYRKSKSRIQVETIAIHETRRRNEISPAKRQFLDAVRNVIGSLSEFWPLSLRQIHYQLLNSPPLIHSGKATSHYGNNKSSYRALFDLCTRGASRELHRLRGDRRPDPACHGVGGASGSPKRLRAANQRSLERVLARLATKPTEPHRDRCREKYLTRGSESGRSAVLYPDNIRPGTVRRDRSIISPNVTSKAAKRS